MSESAVAQKARWAKLTALQQHYGSFSLFLEDGMAELGFVTTDVQLDIGRYMEHGPQSLMVQAQRRQAKTTIAALFAVWCIIHAPSYRVLILSAGEEQASQISTLIVRLILSMDVLECLRPDRSSGDRTSTMSFDVHRTLKGLDKSPSVACVGVEANLQGRRADLLIPDDIESGKNSLTAVQRAKIAHISKDFVSINPTGRIIWLGTPQTMDSIYNSLPARGVEVRIWPGRYPNAAERPSYGNKLAPMLLRRMADDPSVCTGGGLSGECGKPIDPVMLDEETLLKIEKDQGTAYFQLQYMLNTQLSDALRYPLKTEKLVLLQTDGRRAPLTIVRGMGSTHIVEKSVCDFAFRLSLPHELSPETAPFQGIWAYVDPAAGGANGDETAYSVGGFLNGNVVLLACGGIPGGYDEDKLVELAKKLTRFKLDGVTIEKNMGFGAFRQVFTPILRKYIQCQIDDDLVTGQKELRIINTLAPVIGRGALIVDAAVIDEDAECCARYSPSTRTTYSLFHQMDRITAQRQSLVHDDRIDSLEGLVRHYQEAIAQDQNKRLASVRAKAFAESIKDPCGHNRYKTPGQGGRMSLLKRRQ